MNFSYLNRALSILKVKIWEDNLIILNNKGIADNNNFSINKDVEEYNKIIKKY